MNTAAGGTANYSSTALAMPTSIPVTVNGSTTNYPAFQFLNNGVVAAGTYLAADADGDGIPDSGLFRLPVGTINGVTYYAGVRIVDNNSAINVNSAWSRQWDYGPVGGPAYTTGSAPGFTPATGLAMANANITDAVGLYRTNVGLQELLTSYDQNARTSVEMDALNAVRWGYPGSLAVSASNYSCQRNNHFWLHLPQSE